MAFSLLRILKGIVIREESSLSPKEFQLTPSGSSGTKTTLTTSQTADRTVILPDANDTLVGKVTVDTLENKTIVVADNTITTAPSGNLVSTELNAALAELEAEITQFASDLQDHINDPVDAHNASAISVIPSGNLTATDVQSALEELQLDIDDYDDQLPIHIADTSTHGVTGDIVGTTDNQTLENKNILAPTFSDITIFTEQSSVVTTPASGQRLLYAKADGFYEKDSLGVENLIGSGGAIPTNGGADIRTISTDLTLTSADGRLQKLYSNSGVGDLSVFLPDATTLTEGGPVFIIKNDGFNIFNIRDSIGNLLAIIGSKQLGTFNLADNSTVAGTWTVGNQSYTSTAFAELLFGSYSSIGTVFSGSIPSITQMTDNTYLGSYVENTTLNVMLIPFSVTTNIVTFGTPVISGSVQAVNSIVTKIDTGKAVLFYIELSGGNTFARVVDMTGLILTTYTEVGLGFQSDTSTTFPEMQALTTTSLLLITGRQSAAFQDARVLTVTGNTISGVGLPAGIASSNNSFAMKVINSTSAIAVFQATSDIWNTATISISGTTVVWNSVSLILNSGGAALTNFNLTQLTPTKFLAVCMANAPTNNGYISIISIISGNAVPVGAVLISTLSGVASTYPNIVALKSDKAFLILRNIATSQEHYLTININGNVISTNMTGIISATVFVNSKLIAPSSSKIILVGRSAGFESNVFEVIDV